MPPELLTRRASLEPTTLDETHRTVDVVWTTGAGVRRRDTAGVYEERLSLEREHVDLSRLVGAPLLDAHRQDTIDQVLGVVTAAHVDGIGRATVKLSERAEPVWKDIRAGILRHVSVGYSVDQWRDSHENGLRVRTAVRWTPKELSLVAIPADAGATVRGDDMDKDPTDDTGADQKARAAVNTEIRKLVAAAKLDRSVADSLIDRGASLDEAKV